MKPVTVNTIKIGLAWILGGIFLVSVGAKIVDGQPFMNFAEVAFSVPSQRTSYFYMLVVMIEAALGTALLTTYHRSWPFWSVGALITCFSFVIVYALAAGLKTSCGCFGSLLADDGISSLQLVRNIGMVAVVFGPAFWPVEQQKKTAE